MYNNFLLQVEMLNATCLFKCTCNIIKIVLQSLLFRRETRHQSIYIMWTAATIAHVRILCIVILFVRDVPDTTLLDTGFNRIVIYWLSDLLDSSKFKHKS